jgi:ABC-type multidrug transport system ATPase subunit/glyoxylase-like metal-dependent hydrolase (beta-lactamase superfamily II)
MTSTRRAGGLETTAAGVGRQREAAGAARAMPDDAIATEALRKVYHRKKGEPVVALDGIDLRIPRGAFFGLLGPNGAGKSTFINILAGLVNKTSGRVQIWGSDLDRETRGARLSIGVVPQELVLDPFFTAREALEVQAGYYGVRKHERCTEELLTAVGLTDQATTYPRSLSGGMRRRLMVAKALVHSPPIVILDEPTAGVDVELRQQLWAYVRRLNDEGTTVVLTTHYLEEAEALCDRIAIIHNGQVVAYDETRALLDRLDNKDLVIVTADTLDAVPAGLDRYDVELRSPRQLRIRYSRQATEIGEILDAVLSGTIPFVRELAFEYGEAAQVSPLIRRVVAHNPSVFTFHGTGTYIVGHGNVAIIDAGPDLPAHVDAVLNAVRGETVTHVVVTHTHLDHSPATRHIKAATGAPTYGFGPHGGDGAAPAVEEGADREFAPDHRVADGEVITGDGWTLEGVHTPGHTSNHLCFALAEERALFSGDHVMGWSTTVVSPPDGDMGAYLESLEKLVARDVDTYWPTHGAPIPKPQRYARLLHGHRRLRETKILGCVSEGETSVPEIVARLYSGIDKRLHKAAARTVFAHLIHLVETERVACDETPTEESRYRVP